MSDHEKYDGSFLRQFHRTVDLVLHMAAIRDSAKAGTSLSREMVQILALVRFDGVEIGGPAREDREQP